MSVRDLTILGCSSQQPTRFRNHGAYLLRWNDEGFLFDPGEGTQRQFIFADIAPPVVTRILISHFHGDHCLGFVSMLMRLILDGIEEVHCYFPASGQKYFDRLCNCCIYQKKIRVIEHPVSAAGLVHSDGKFQIEAHFLDHGVENVGWRVTEADQRKFDKKALQSFGIAGPMMKELQSQGFIHSQGKKVLLEEVSSIRKGDTFSYVVDTRPCPAALEVAKGAKMLLCESTYLESEKELAHEYRHMTAKQAAQIACDAGVETLILTHFSARYRDATVLEQEAREIFPNTFAADDLKRFLFQK
jgi:ribonuclease Z